MDVAIFSTGLVKIYQYRESHPRRPKFIKGIDYNGRHGEA
jgi:hypothetical protein